MAEAVILIISGSATEAGNPFSVDIVRRCEMDQRMFVICEGGM
jgi:hypothetical protein